MKVGGFGGKGVRAVLLPAIDNSIMTRFRRTEEERMVTKGRLSRRRS